MLNSKLKLLLFLSLYGCSQGKDTTSLYSIISKANCKGPSGMYHTELHATTDGYTRFHQSFSNGDQDYDAVAYSDTLGFVVSNGSVERKTESAEISVGKGHSFHMIALSPSMIFNQTNGGRYLDNQGREVVFKYDSLSDRILSFNLINPFDTLESIEIYYSQWEKVEGLELPMQVQIIQGGKDNFFFEFYEVKIDAPTFAKIDF
ncbi:MAG: hypothetical protein ABJF04_08715 [Reichenbachiella sp.]|uniref:hypothetical protein n=1 Tax=Reichenbachiella sp. TaxID=2184521 RepID=UPI003264A2D5